jgi:L-amino acid N-acyltransferase YncA
MQIKPITFKQAKEFIANHHRHNKPPVGWKFGCGLVNNKGELIGVATAGRPIARNINQDTTIEVNRTCTLGDKNANSKLYAAIIKAAKALGYKKIITYTQADESGASLKAVQMKKVKKLSPRPSWKNSSKKLAHIRDDVGNGGIARIRWELKL